MKVPWMPKNRIRNAAEALLDHCRERCDAPLDPPVPVEAVIEQGLGLQLGLVDFDLSSGFEDVLGAIYLDRRLVCINTRLLDDAGQGRFAFTCAHEAGHWVLHRPLMDDDPDGGHRILCRSHEGREPVEWQADYFAACLLMPEAPLRASFAAVYGPAPLEIQRIDSTFRGPLGFDPCVRNWRCIAAEICIAGGFANVSQQAMMIRLQDLGLVVNCTAAAMGR